METGDYSSSRRLVIGQQFNPSKNQAKLSHWEELARNFTKIAHAHALLRKSYRNTDPPR
jgi:hypothetical protein